MRRIDVFISKLSEKESELRVQSYLIKNNNNKGTIILHRNYTGETPQNKS